MINVSVNTEIDLPTNDVFAYLADVSRHPIWQSGVRSTTWTSSPPIRVGSTYDQEMDYRDLVTGYEVTAIDPSRSMTIETRAGATMPATVTRRVDPIGERRCRITVDVVGKPRGFRRLIKPLVSKVVRDSIESDYRRLKRTLEAPEEDP